jgi:secondary thiamine-phosphate synthase enzyme
MHLEISVKSEEREQFIEIGDKINKLLTENGINDGCCTVFVCHTTAAVTVNENADPDVAADLLAFLRDLVPQNGGYRHREGNSDAHIKTSLVGTSLQVIIKNGSLDLGKWQGLFLAEFDGPRTRRVKLWVE